MVLIVDQQSELVVDLELVKKTVEGFLQKLNLEDWSLSVVIVDAKTMAEYNLAYRKKDGPTNVLAFPLYPDRSAQDPLPTVDQDNPADLGDIFVCPSKILAEASDRGITFEKRLTRLLAHSVLHLLGYLHDTQLQFEDMLAKEEFLLGYQIDPESD